MKTGRLPQIAVLSALLATGTSAMADVVVQPEGTLQGLSGVNLAFVLFDEDARRAGYDQHTFETAVEARLRMAGIRLLSQAERSRTPGQPMLSIVVAPVRPQTGRMSVYSIDLDVHLRVRLEGNNAVATARTYGQGYVGLGSPSDALESLNGVVDAFVNAWLSVNKK